MKTSTTANNDHGRRSSTTVAAFLIGLPLASVILGYVFYGPLPADLREIFQRYLGHRVEQVEVILFCCALGTLVVKLWGTVTEKRAFSNELIAAWDGKPIPVAEASKLLAAMNRRPTRLQKTWLGQRLRAVVEFICQRRSAADLDDHIRTLADNDVMSLESSYALTRFITWAMPILGFLGTVLGITGAIANISPDKLEGDGLSSVTNGLALAFDATALALSMTMITMFCTFLVEKIEQSVLEAVDQIVDRELAHRFERAGTEQTPFLDAVRSNSQILLDATGQLVERQAMMWAHSLEEIDRRGAGAQAQQQKQLVAALETAISASLQQHSQRLVALEKQTLEQTTALLQQLAALASAVRDTGREQQAALVRVAENVADQAAVLGQLQSSEQHLLQSQTLLQQNLQTLVQTGAFEEAVHSLTAAIHLLTSRAGAYGPPATLPGIARSPTGKAA